MGKSSFSTIGSEEKALVPNVGAPEGKARKGEERK